MSKNSRAARVRFSPSDDGEVSTMNEPGKALEASREALEEGEGFDCGFEWSALEARYEQAMRARSYAHHDFKTEGPFGRGVDLWHMVHGEHADFSPRSIEELALRLLGEERPSAALMRGFVKGAIDALPDDEKP